MTSTPRPAHLDLTGITGDIVETGPVTDIPGSDPVFQMTLPPHRPVAASADIDRAAARLLQATKIVLVAGEGATVSKAGKEVLAMGQRLAAPIATSLGGRGLIPTRHPLSIGCAGNYAAPPANQIVHEADLVVFIGCDTGDQVTHAYCIPTLSTPCIQIDIDPAELGRSYPNTLGLMGDPKATLAALLDALGAPQRDTAFADRAARIVVAWRETMAQRLASDAVPIWPDRLCAEITARPAARRHPGRRHRLVRHLEQHADRPEWRGANLSARRGLPRLVLPGRARRQMRRRARKVICWSGDGGDLLPPDGAGNGATARHRGDACGQQQLRLRPGLAGYPAPAGQPARQPRKWCCFGPTNFADVARVFGLRGIRVEDPAQIGPALREAIASDETVVVDVATNIDIRAPEPWAPQKS